MGPEKLTDTLLEESSFGGRNFFGSLLLIGMRIYHMSYPYLQWGPLLNSFPSASATNQKSASFSHGRWGLVQE